MPGWAAGTSSSKNLELCTLVDLVVLEALTQTVALVLALSGAAALLMASTGKFQKTKKKKKNPSWDFPGSPVTKIPFFHCRGHRFNPWLGN